MTTLTLKRKPADGPRQEAHSPPRTIADCDDGLERRLRMGLSNGHYVRSTYSTREPHEPVAPKHALERFKMKPKRKGKR